MMMIMMMTTTMMDEARVDDDKVYHWQLQAVWMANWLYTRKGWYLDLLIWSDGTKHDFCEVLRGEHAETDSTNRLVVLNQR